jgi:Cft2 family RNA processing exonuclease
MLIRGTSSFTFAKSWLKQKDSAIFTVGYMDTNTPGYVIANSECGDKIQLTEYDESTEVKCKINNFKFSAHARREDLLKIVDKLKPDNVILTHGDEDAIGWMGASILKKNKNIKVYTAITGKEIIF